MFINESKNETIALIIKAVNTFPSKNYARYSAAADAEKTKWIAYSNNAS